MHVCDVIHTDISVHFSTYMCIIGECFKILFFPCHSFVVLRIRNVGALLSKKIKQTFCLYLYVSMYVSARHSQRYSLHVAESLILNFFHCESFLQTVKG